ncbi:MAG: thiolase family protein [Alphaproteobacteria bacterium]|nr:thiolase family protein [Alphaproteobacteria bacterium]NCQ88389.1 thiolase family protein [Alphaproteobacteria bacterium]NCT05931.1 thiolase family protein [Alphaproteobacteria bacterium]
MQKPVVICGYKRSPFTFANKGALAKTRPDTMAAEVIKALIADTGVDANDIEDILMGCAFPEAEQGFNLAKIVAQLAGLPNSVAGATVNRFCGSSMTTIQMAAGYIQMNAGDVFICAGVESMTRIPMGGFNPMPNPAMMELCPAAYIGMGETAENLAKKYKIDRDTQENFAVNSQNKAAAAQASGKFKNEIVLIDGVSEDGCIRAGTTKEALASLNLAFDEKGTVTAGTASPLTDGAAAVLVASEEYAKKHKLPILARIRSVGVAGCDASIMGIGPVPATQKALSRAGLTIDDIDIAELNEAFSAQSISVLHDLKLSEDKVNLDGGAIAIGHPLGASGARITGKLASLMQRENKKIGLATMCIGGGQGTAIILEKV